MSDFIESVKALEMNITPEDITAAWIRNGRSTDFTGIWGCFEEKNNMDLT